MRGRFFYGSLGAAVGLLASTHAIGQAAADSNVNVNSFLEEVVVTARKREENLQDVPVAISVLTADTLIEQGINDATALFDNAPGLGLKQGIDSLSFTPAVRGVVANETPSIRQKVSTFYDGLPTAGQQGTAPFGAIAQVEVLRGPQSAAFGRSTFGGAINYVTRDPGDTLEVQAGLELGSNYLLDANALVSGPIAGDWLKGLLAVSHHSLRGESDWISSDGYLLGLEENNNVLAKLIVNPFAGTEIELRFKWLDVDNGGLARHYVDFRDPKRKRHPDAQPSNTPVPCGISATQASNASCAYQGSIDADANATFDQNFTELGLGKPRALNNRKRYELELNQDLPGDYQLQVMGHTSDEFFKRVNDLDLTNTNALRALGFTAAQDIALQTYSNTPTEIDETYAEARLNSPADNRFRYGGGVSWYDYDYLALGFANVANYNNFLLTGNPALIGNGYLNETATNTGYFFSTQFDFTDSLTASLEGRYQTDKVSGANTAGLRVTNTTKAFLPRLALTFSPIPNLTIYGQAAKGNNPTGVNAGSIQPAIIAASLANPNIFDFNKTVIFEEEKITSFEIGIKGTWADRFRYAVSLYKLDWQGYTQPVALNYEPANFNASDVNNDNIGDANTPYAGQQFDLGTITASTGDVDGKGIEFEGNFAVTRKFDVGLTAALMDTKYANGACSATALEYGVLANARTPSQPANAPFNCVSIAGKEIPTQPKFIATLNLAYNLPLDNGGEWFTRWSTNYNSKQWLDEMNLAYLDAFSISSLRTGFRKDGWSFELYGTNLFDEDSLIGIGSPADNRLRRSLGAPGLRRTISYTERRSTAYGVRMSYKL